MAMNLGTLIAAAVMIFAPALAHDEDQIGYVPRTILEKPVALRPGVGNAHEKVSTTSTEAQAFYDQGLNYLHSYVWIEAARSFHQALRHDPKLAMAWVGVSKAYSGIEDAKAAQAALDKAKALDAAPWEKTRINLRQLQLDAMAAPKNVEKFAAYKNAIDAALATRMDDAELWLIRGNAEEPFPAGRGQRGGAGSIAFYKQALVIKPDHSAAHHYLVHSYEVIGQIAPALASGEIYANAAFTVAHAWHMWGHDLRRGAQIDKAIEVFTKADQIERDYYENDGIDAMYDWHHAHNLDLLAGSYQYMGKIEDAAALYRQIFDMKMSPERRDSIKRAAVNFLIDRSMWDEAEKATASLARSPYEEMKPWSQLLGAEIALGRGDKAKAAAAVEAAKSGTETLDRESLAYIGLKRGLGQMAAALELKGGGSQDARNLYVKAIADMRAVLGPDAWIQALYGLERIAQMARRAGDWELAKIATENMMDHDPAYGGSHYAAALLAAHHGDRATERAALEKARQLWQKADPDFPELKDINRRLAEMS